MAATLDCIGISAGSPEQLSDWLSKWAASTREIHRNADISHSLWRDYSGAAVAIHVQKGRVVCITPWFTSPDGPTKWHVESRGAVIDPDCLDCSGADLDLLDERGIVQTRAAVQWLFFRPYRDWLSTERRYRIEVAAFAEQCETFASKEEFDRRSTDFKLASIGFVPVGMFGEMKEGGLRARARATFAGTLRQVIRRENTVTGEKFLQLRVSTLPGDIDVVHPATSDLRPEPGHIALVSAWIVGRPVDPPPPPRSFWRRLFRR